MVVHLLISAAILLGFLCSLISILRDFRDRNANSRLYNFCEKYLIAFDNPSYGELVVHPPPVCLLCLILLPYAGAPIPLRQVSKCFSKLISRMENVLILIILIPFELGILAILYFKIIFYTVILTTHHRTLTLLIWIFCGPFLLFFYIVIDILHFG